MTPGQSAHAQDLVLQRLKTSLERGRLGHALLLAGGSGRGAYDIALKLSGVLLGIARDTPGGAIFRHPDFLCLSPLPPQSQRSAEGPDPVPAVLAEDPYGPLNVGANWGITADQARRMIQWASMSPWEARHKACLIAEADRVNEASADIMLKTLEEPPRDVTLLLVTDRPQDLLPTVRSRCQETRIPPLSGERLVELLVERGTSAADAAEVASLAQGDLRQAENLLRGDTNELRKTALALIGDSLNPAMKTADVLGSARKATERSGPAEISETIRWMLWWMRDLLLIVEGIRSTRSELEAMAEWGRKVGRERLADWLLEADRSYEMLGRNVTPAAVLAALMMFPRDQRYLGTEPVFPPADLVIDP